MSPKKSGESWPWTARAADGCEAFWNRDANNMHKRLNNNYVCKLTNPVLMFNTTLSPCHGPKKPCGVGGHPTRSGVNMVWSLPSLPINHRNTKGRSPHCAGEMLQAGKSRGGSETCFLVGLLEAKRLRFPSVHPWCVGPQMEGQVSLPGLQSSRNIPNGLKWWFPSMGVPPNHPC